MLEQAATARPRALFLLLNQAEEFRTAAEFLERLGLRRLHAISDRDRAVARLYAAVSIPTTIFIDASGYLQVIETGELTWDRLNAGLARIGASSTSSQWSRQGDVSIGPGFSAVAGKIASDCREFD